MRRIGYVIIFVFIIGALAGATPWVDGYLFQKDYQADIAAINSTGNIQIKITEYNLGWLSSDIKLSLAFPTLAQASPTPQSSVPTPIVTIDQHITHGPLINDPNQGRWVFALALIQSNLHLPNENKVIAKDATQGVLQADALVDFNGKYTTQIQTPVFSMNNGAGKLSWQGLKGTLTADVQNHVVVDAQSDLQFAPFLVTSDYGSFSLQEMKWQAERACQQPSLCGGSSTVAIANMDAQGMGSHFKVGSINLETKYGPSGSNQYDNSLDLAISKVNASVMSYADYSVDKATLKITSSHLNGAAVEQLLQKVRSDSDMNANTNPSARMDAFNALLPPLVTPDTTIATDVAMNTSVGDLTSQGKMSWPKNTALPKTMAELGKGLNVNIETRVSVSLVDEVIKVLDGEAPATPAATPATTNPAATPAAPSAATQPQPPASAPDATASTTATPAAPKANIEEEIESLMHQKKISEDVGIALIQMHKEQVDYSIFTKSVDTFAASKQLPADVATQLKNDYPRHEEASAAAAADTSTAMTATGASPASNNLEARVNQLVQQNIITSDVGKAIIDLSKQQLAPSIFAQGIDQFVTKGNLKPDIGKQLKDQYAKNQVSTEGTSATGLNGEVTTTPPPPPKPKEGSARAQFDAWLKQGYVKKDNDSYVFTVDYEQGVMKVNDIVVPMPQ
jgi:uncharacterized protein YdgA (DUF945 family)